jgi:hypothetical protein
MAKCVLMAKPIKHRGKWKIRWTDHTGKRRSEVYERYQDADEAGLRHRLEVAEIKRGHRTPVERGRTHTELFDYWLAARAPLKRSGGDSNDQVLSTMVSETRGGQGGQATPSATLWERM